jgi:hypothetical protein
LRRSARSAAEKLKRPKETVLPAGIGVGSLMRGDEFKNGAAEGPVQGPNTNWELVAAPAHACSRRDSAIEAQRLVGIVPGFQQFAPGIGSAPDESKREVAPHRAERQ